MNTQIFSWKIHFRCAYFHYSFQDIFLHIIVLRVPLVPTMKIRCWSIQFSSFWPLDRTISDATSSGLSWYGSHGNKGVQHISQNSSIPGDLTIRLFSVIFRACIGGGLPSAEMQPVYSATPADWAMSIIHARSRADIHH